MARFAQPEKQEEEVDGSTVLAVDSPEAVTMTDLDTLGRTAVQFSQGVTGGGDSGATSSKFPPRQYVAMCTAFVHNQAFYQELVEPNGVWVSDLRDTMEQAQDDVAGHDDGGAALYMTLGMTLLGPYLPGG